MSDEAIVELMQSQDERDVRRGMQLLVEVYGARIETTVALFSPGVDPHGREDIRQDALLRISKSIGARYRHRGQLWAYIKTVIRGVSTDAYRRKARIDRRTTIFREPGADEAGAPEPEAPPEERPDWQLIRAERIRSVRRAVGQLQPSCREVVDLHYREGFRYREISERLGIAVGTVSSRLARCLEQLSGFLGNPRFPGNNAPFAVDKKMER